MNEKQNACLLCGAPLRYLSQAEELKCDVCHQTYASNARCENGHFICDACHSAPGARAIRYAAGQTAQKDPIAIARMMMNQPAIHMHGPEHHNLAGAALLVAYHNCGGKLDLDQALTEMGTRSSQVPGGTCGFWGACGAALSVGIAMSILTGATPLTQRSWSLCNGMVSDCLKELARVGGPRCCKRTTFLSLLTASRWVEQALGVALPVKTPVVCGYFPKNKECLRQGCPFYPQKAEQTQKRQAIRLRPVTAQ